MVAKSLSSIQLPRPLPLPRQEDIEAIYALALAGRLLDAYARASSYASFDEWTDPRAARMASLLAESLGAPKRARRIVLRAIRRSPLAPIARLLRLGVILETRGPFAAWEALSAEPAFGADATKDDLFTRRLCEATVLSQLRDFREAHRALDAAAAMAVSGRKLDLVRAGVLALEDRYPEALAAAERAREPAPHAPDTVRAVAHLRLLVGDESGALELLREVAAATQSADVARQVAGVLAERRLHEERAEWIERYAERIPLAERECETLLTCMRADCAFDRGDFATALRLARASGSPFHLQVAEHLARAVAGGPSGHALLEVSFVRQHHMTCVPATLTMLSAYWGLSVSHVEIAEAICYDGTPHHSQRTWAESNGFVVREFTATWESARALLDRGIPFTVATAPDDRGHLQAIVGYDERRGTLSIRDPFIPVVMEALAAEWLDHWRATGPHAMVIVPVGEAARLEGLSLPKTELCDVMHRVSASLARHDRPAASEAMTELARAAPEHRLSVAARRAIAAYDQDAERVLACALTTAASHPAYVFAQIDAIGCMRQVRPRSERIARAEALAAAHPKQPIYLEVLAREIADDAREHARAARLLRRALRGRPDRHTSLGLLGEIEAGRGALRRVLALRRIAACAGRFDDGAAYAYFVASLADGPALEEALAFLEDRARTLGRRSAGPWKVLFVALQTLGRGDDGLRRIDGALASRADDGPLLLAAADAHGGLGDLEVARDLLARAEGGSKRTDWLRAAALLALRTGDVDARRARLEESLAIEPLDSNANAAYALAVAGARGASAVRTHLDEVHARFPHARPVSRLRLFWANQGGPREVERVAREAVATDPADVFAQRQLAAALLDQGRLDEAAAAIAAAADLAPRSAPLERCRAELARRRGDRAAMRASLLAAVSIDPDDADAIGWLLGDAEDAAERASLLDSVEERVRSRSVTGTGIMTWYLAARPVRDPHDLAAALERLRAERAGLWVSWSCAVRQRAYRGDHAGAVELATEECARFSAVAGAWTDLADARLAAGQLDLALEALKRAAVLDVEDEVVPARLANVHARRGDPSRAKEVVQRALRRLPASVSLRLQLASFLWAEGARAEALQEVQVALSVSPSHARAWTLLDEWSAEAGDGSQALARIEALCLERPFSPEAAIAAARARLRRGDHAGALAALERATTADPRFQDGHDLRAIVLFQLGRHREALAACSPPAYETRPPRELRGRAAWIRASSGDLEGAANAMRSILEENPDYTWGWLQLASWNHRRGAVVERVAAARKLVLASPHLAAAHTELADALFEMGDRATAKAELARAIDLSPADEGPSLVAFETSLEDGDAAAAAAIVEVLRSSRSAAGRSAEIRLKAHQGDASGAIQALRALVVDTTASADAITRARQACILAGFVAECAAVFADALEDPRAHESVGRAWVRDQNAADPAAIARTLARLDPKLPAAEAAAEAWLSSLERQGESSALLDAARLLRRRFPDCGDLLWARVASGLTALRGSQECVAWTADWGKRSNAPSWALLQAAKSRRDAGLDEEAFAVVSRAASLATDGASASHRTWLAFELATRGSYRDAKTWLERAGAVDDVPVLSSIGGLTGAMLCAASPDGAWSRYRQALGELRAARPQGGWAALNRAHERACARIGAELGFPLGAALRHRDDLRAVGVALLVVVGLIGFVALATVMSSSSTASSGTSLAPLVWIAVFGLRALARRKTR